MERKQQEEGSKMPTVKPCYPVYHKPTMPSSVFDKDCVERQNSFTKHNYPTAHSKNYFEMAACTGLSFSGRYDMTKCFKCGLNMQDWFEDCDINLLTVEHYRNSKNCPHLLQILSKDFRDKIEQWLEDPPEKSLTIADRRAPENYHRVALSLKHVRHQDRVDSFEKFPDLNQKEEKEVKKEEKKVPAIPIKELATLGFYYKGIEQHISCYACNRRIDKSSQYDSNRHHHTWCSHLKEMNE